MLQGVIKSSWCDEVNITFESVLLQEHMVKRQDYHDNEFVGNFSDAFKCDNSLGILGGYNSLSDCYEWIKN